MGLGSIFKNRAVSVCVLFIMIIKPKYYFITFAIINNKIVVIKTMNKAKNRLHGLLKKNVLSIISRTVNFCMNCQ